MGLRIQNNIAALNTQRQLQVSGSGLEKSLQRLSSGYRINSASDDAAGLAISQGFRADIASYKVAAQNTSEASSLLKVAEGATDQIANMLVRLKELATQAASANAGSNLDKINSEAQQVITEINRIANSTQYAGTTLLSGSFGVGASAGSTSTVTSAANGYSGAIGMKTDETYNIASTLTAGVGTMTITTGNGSETIYFAAPSAGTTKQVSFASMGLTLTVNSSFSSAMDGALIGKHLGNATFQVGSMNNGDNQIAISLGDATKTGLGISTLTLDTAANAQAALTTINTAISNLSTVQGNIGAFMNRLSYANANLSSTIENVTASESTIRHVDMASEMTTFTKNQILQQAGVAMLAQANSAPQQVLSLFK